jgi:hypothetical protein
MGDSISEGHQIGSGWQPGSEYTEPTEPTAFGPAKKEREYPVVVDWVLGVLVMVVLAGIVAIFAGIWGDTRWIATGAMAIIFSVIIGALAIVGVAWHTS